MTNVFHYVLNKPGPVQVGTTLKFFEYAKDIFRFPPKYKREENHDLCWVFFPNSAMWQRSPSLDYFNYLTILYSYLTNFSYQIPLWHSW